MMDGIAIDIVDEPFLRARRPYGAFLESYRSNYRTLGAAEFQVV